MSQKRSATKRQARVAPRVTRDDTVLVISGNERGRTGRVLAVFPGREKALVEGINLIKRHSRPTPTNPQGGIVEREAPIHLSNLLLVCDKCGRGTRIGHRFHEDGSKARYCKHCGEEIPRKA